MVYVFQLFIQLFMAVLAALIVPVLRPRLAGVWAARTALVTAMTGAIRPVLRPGTAVLLLVVLLGINVTVGRAPSPRVYDTESAARAVDSGWTNYDYHAAFSVIMNSDLDGAPEADLRYDVNQNGRMDFSDVVQISAGMR